MNSSITFRPINDDDLEFLYRVYASTRAEEMQLTGWPVEAQETFLRMQFQAQHAYYQQTYRDADFDIILLDNQPVGRLYVRRCGDEHRLVDIALLPEHRGQGTGSTILRGLLDEAAAARKPMRLRVEPFNPALRLYERFGFVQIADEQVNWHMEWTGRHPVQTNADA